MNDSIVCEKCNYDLFMVCPDGLTVCNHCGEFSSFSTHPPIAPPAIVEPARSAAEPVGYISGWINNGHLVIRLLDPALALSTGTALFLQPQIVPPAIVEQIKAIKICTAWKDLVRLDDVLKILEAGNDL